MTSARRDSNRRSLLLLLAVSVVANLALGWRLFGPTENPGPPDSAVPRELRPYAALGSHLAENNRIPSLRWSEEQFSAFLAGMRSTYEGAGYPLDEDATQLRDDISRRVQAMIDAEQPDPVQEYFKTLREQENVSRTSSDLHYRITMEGSGSRPQPTDTVVVSYAARTPGGDTLEHLSRARVTAKVQDLLPGLAEGVQLLQPGGKGLIYVPSALSFGSGQWPERVPPGMPLAFFLELHEIVAP